MYILVSGRVAVSIKKEINIFEKENRKNSSDDLTKDQNALKPLY
jgi:hypothetical protein